MQSPTAALTPGTVLLGKLRIVRLIGQGGMATVYEVEHELTKHRRAVKLLNPDMAAIPGVVARFLREASAAGRIGSPHIIETFDAGTLESGEPYIVMELLDGQTLDRLIAQRVRLAFDEAIEIIRQACLGIQAAHDAGIVHRDLKPENLYLLSRERPFVKVLDFGISKFDPSRTGDHKLTLEGSALGTPYYMSPEQVRGVADLDGRTDVYALGVVLYECLTGQKPYVAQTLPAIAVLIHEGKYLPIRELRPETPPELERIVASAIAVDRQRRYESPAQLSADLSAVRQALTGVGGTMVVPEGASTGATLHQFSDSALPAETGVPAASLVLPAATDAGVEKHTAAERRSWVKPAVWALVLVALVGLVVLALGVGGSEPPTAEQPPESNSTSVAAAPPPAAVAREPAEPQSPAAAADAGSIEAGADDPAENAVPRSSPDPAPVKKTRAAQHGLAEENPF